MLRQPHTDIDCMITAVRRAYFSDWNWIKFLEKKCLKMFQIQFPSDSDLRILSGQYVGIRVNNPYWRQPDCITDSGWIMKYRNEYLLSFHSYHQIHLQTNFGLIPTQSGIQNMNITYAFLSESDLFHKLIRGIVSRVIPAAHARKINLEHFLTELSSISNITLITSAAMRGPWEYCYD